VRLICFGRGSTALLWPIFCRILGKLAYRMKINSNLLKTPKKVPLLVELLAIQPFYSNLRAVVAFEMGASTLDRIIANLSVECLIHHWFAASQVGKLVATARGGGCD
jgi:hypothetical protein